MGELTEGRLQEVSGCLGLAGLLGHPWSNAGRAPSVPSEKPRARAGGFASAPGKGQDKEAPKAALA